MSADDEREETARVDLRRIVVVSADDHEDLRRTYFQLARYTRGLLMGKSKSTWADVDMIV